MRKPRALVPDFTVILGLLTPREEQILRMRLGLWASAPDRPRLTYVEIGRQFMVGRERIRQIEHRALRKLLDPARLYQQWKWQQERW